MKIVEQIRDRFKDKAEIFEKSKKRIYVTAADKEAGKELVRYLFKELGARMAIASGVDTRPGVEILYHMAFDKHNLIVTVKVLVKKPELKMLSFTGFMEGASWIEREMHELLGVDFVGHPDQRTLLLSDDWEPGVCPLRKKTFESAQENAERDYR